MLVYDISGCLKDYGNKMDEYEEVPYGEVKVSYICVCVDVCYLLGVKYSPKWTEVLTS